VENKKERIIIVKLVKISILISFVFSSCGDYGWSHGKIVARKKEKKTDNEVYQEMRGRGDVYGDEMVWEMAREQDNIDAYKFYLGQFPSGKYAKRAERRMWKLKRRAQREHDRAVRRHHRELQGEDTEGKSVYRKMREMRRRAGRFNDGRPPYSWFERLFMMHTFEKAK
jgi:hypothetical protein